MEATHDPLPSGEAARSSSSVGELIPQNSHEGQASGVVLSAVTLLGQAADCDVRLAGKGIRRFHCVLVQSGAGLLLRDLGKAGATLVNGRPESTSFLRDGDLLTLGCLEFRVRTGACAAGDLERAKEALRIQAAAVVAQQAALTEEEIRLQQRQTALERQEQQLAAHLEEKRRRLLAIRDEARQAHHTLLDDRARYEQRVALVMEELAQARREVADQKRHLQSERSRLQGLRRRLKRRWHRHWAGERAVMRRREEAVADRYRALAKERQRLQEDKDTLLQAQLRFNSAVELGRRQLHSERETLREAEQELQQRARNLAKSETVLAYAERQLALDQQQWTKLKYDLKMEAEGLEKRIANYRPTILDLERHLARLRKQSLHPLSTALGDETVLPAISMPISPDDSGQHSQPNSLGLEEGPPHPLVSLECLAEALSDQQWLLTEQCAHLAEAQHRWEQEQAAAAGELAAASEHLQREAQLLSEREQALELVEQDLRRRAEEIAQGHRQVEALKARLSVGVANWEGERGRLLVQIQAREEMVQQHWGLLVDLRNRWDKRRHRQVLGLRARRNSFEDLRRECGDLRADWSRRCATLEQKQRALAEQALALEQYRQEYIAQAAHPKTAEKRLERLRRRWTGLNASAQRSIAKERAYLEAEAARLDKRARQLHEQEEEITSRQAGIAAREVASEKREALADQERDRLTLASESLRRQREHYEMQLESLRAEAEHLAWLLLDETDRPLLPVVQAA